RFPPSARAPKTNASAATSRAASWTRVLPFPSIVLHDESRHRLHMFPLEHTALALVPAPGLFVPADAAKDDFVRQMRSREGEQLSAERTALIVRRDEQLVEIEFWQMQRQHGGEGATVVGDEQTPTLLDFLRNTGAQFREQEVAGLLQAGRSPALHPDAGDLVIFVCAGRADRGVQYRL